METTTIKVSKDFAVWWKRCCKAKSLNSTEFGENLREACQLKKQADFYLGLEMPSKYKKPLADKKVIRSAITFNSANGAVFDSAQKDKTRRTTKQYVKSGKLVKPRKCELCGRVNTSLNTHHIDYSNPENIKWLCFYCHKHAHKN